MENHYHFHYNDNIIIFCWKIKFKNLCIFLLKLLHIKLNSIHAGLDLHGTMASVARPWSWPWCPFNIFPLRFSNGALAKSPFQNENGLALQG